MKSHFVQRGHKWKLHAILPKISSFSCFISSWEIKHLFWFFVHLHQVTVCCFWALDSSWQQLQPNRKYLLHQGASLHGLLFCFCIFLSWIHSLPFFSWPRNFCYFFPYEFVFVLKKSELCYELIYFCFRCLVVPTAPFYFIFLYCLVTFGDVILNLWIVSKYHVKSESFGFFKGWNKCFSYAFPMCNF